MYTYDLYTRTGSTTPSVHSYRWDGPFRRYSCTPRTSPRAQLLYSPPHPSCTAVPAGPCLPHSCTARIIRSAQLCAAHGTNCTAVQFELLRGPSRAAQMTRAAQLCAWSRISGAAVQTGSLVMHSCAYRLTPTVQLCAAAHSARTAAVGGAPAMRGRAHRAARWPHACCH